MTEASVASDAIPEVSTRRRVVEPVDLVAETVTYDASKWRSGGISRMARGFRVLAGA
jgi:hypothetical protein